MECKKHLKAKRHLFFDDKNVRINSDVHQNVILKENLILCAKGILEDNELFLGTGAWIEIHNRLL